MYVEYAGDVINTVRHWLDGKPDPTEVADTYSGQFLDAFPDSRVLLVVPANEPGKLVSQNIKAVHCQHPWRYARGARWHVGQVMLMGSIVLRGLAFRPSSLFVSSMSYMFLLAPLRLLGTRLHVIFRTSPAGVLLGKSKIQRMLGLLNRTFIRLLVRDAIALEPRVTKEVEALCPSLRGWTFGFLPSYRSRKFNAAPRGAPSPPYRLLYVGRVERNKGIFDFVDMLASLVNDYGLDCRADVCGTGSSLEAVQEDIRRRKLEGRITCHGHCTAETMLRIYEAAHVCVVPTRSECGEGFNKVVAEACLSGLPVVTSPICPAVDLLGEGVVLAEPDSVPSYVTAIRRLLEQPAEYGRVANGALVASAGLGGRGTSFRDALGRCVPARPKATPVVTV